MKDRLTRDLLLKGIRVLAERDKSLAKVMERYGPPPMWSRKAGFASLVKIILEQQVSLASAESLYRKLGSRVPEINPFFIDQLNINGLRELGFTHQKAGYCHGIAESILSGSLNLEKIGRMENEDAYQTLINIRGVGPWTANIYLLMVLRRQDIWPDGDLALAESARQIKDLAERPDYDQLNVMAQKWKPWRSVAARILWHNYLSERKR